MLVSAIVVEIRKKKEWNGYNTTKKKMQQMSLIFVLERSKGVKSLKIEELESTTLRSPSNQSQRLVMMAIH